MTWLLALILAIMAFLDPNQDGIIDEDEPGWICSEMGNRICGKETP
jgi:hypothetical protein